LWRHRALVVRLLETTVALLSLLITHQCLWLLLPRLLNHWDWYTASKRAGQSAQVFVVKGRGHDQRKSVLPGSGWETDEPTINLLSRASDRERQGLQVNGWLLSGLYVGRQWVYYPSISLRRGTNIVTLGSDDTSGRYRNTFQITYIPRVPLPPKLLDALLDENGDVIVFGLGEPGSRVEFHHLNTSHKNRLDVYDGYCNAVGLFSTTIRGSWLLSINDLNWSSLPSKLRDAQDPLSQYLREQFSPELQQHLKGYKNSKFPAQELRQDLVTELNRLLQGSSLFQWDRFSKVALRPETQRLLKQNLQGEGVIRLHRLLLEDAYPQEIASVPTRFLPGQTIALQPFIERKSYSIQRPVLGNHRVIRGEVYRVSRSRTGQPSLKPSFSLRRRLKMTVDKDQRYHMEFRINIPKDTAIDEWGGQLTVLDMFQIFGLYDDSPWGYWGNTVQKPKPSEDKRGVQNGNEVKYEVEGTLPEEGIELITSPHRTISFLALPHDHFEVEAPSLDHVTFNLPPDDTRAKAVSSKPEQNPRATPAASPTDSPRQTPTPTSNQTSASGSATSSANGEKMASSVTTVWAWDGPRIEPNTEFKLLQTGFATSPDRRGLDKGQSDDNKMRSQNVLETLQGLEEKLPDATRRILFALITSIPFLWLLWILKTSPDQVRDGYERLLSAVTLTFLFFHISVLCTPLLTVGYGFLQDLFVPLVHGQYRSAFYTLQRLLDVPPFFVIGSMLLLRPIYLAFLARREHEERRGVSSLLLSEGESLPVIMTGAMTTGAMDSEAVLAAISESASGGGKSKPHRFWRLWQSIKLWLTWHLPRWLIYWPAALLVPLILVFSLFYIEGDEFSRLLAEKAAQQLSWVGEHFILIPSPGQFDSRDRDSDPQKQLIIASAVQQWLGILLTIAVLSFVGFFFWLLRLVLGCPVRARSVLRAAVVMLLLPLIPLLGQAALSWLQAVLFQRFHIPPFFDAEDIGNVVWLLIIVGFGVAILWELTHLTMEIAPQHRIKTFLKSDYAWLLLIPFVILVLPEQYLSNRVNTGLLSLGDIRNLAYAIDDLLLYALLVGLVMLLRRCNPTNYRSLRRDTIEAGALLFTFYLTYLTGRANNLFFIPILILLGYIVFKYGLLTKADAPTLDASLSGLVRDLLDYKQTLRWTQIAHRNLEKEYAKSGTDTNDMVSKCKVSQEVLEKARKKLPLDPAAAERMIFNHGPEATPWENARIAALYGFFLSIPFQKSTLDNILAGNSLGSFPFLRLCYALLYSSCNWLLIALVFGYFFGRIRGRDGLEKAFFYSVALIVPTIPQSLLSAHQLSAIDISLGRDYVVQMVQVVAYVLLLALLAFDLRILHKLNFTWRELLTLHGLTTAATYFVSIAATTLASFSGKDLLGFLKPFFDLLVGAT